MGLTAPQKIDIFLSYARKDLDRVKPLADALAQCGWRIWWDEENLRAGHAFDREIECALAAAQCVVVAWTPASVDSDWVRAEATKALAAKKLVPVFLATVDPPLRFLHTHGVDLNGWDGRPAGAAFDRLIEHIAVLAGRPATLGAAPPPSNSGGGESLHTYALPPTSVPTRSSLTKVIAAVVIFSSLGLGAVLHKLPWPTPQQAAIDSIAAAMVTIPGGSFQMGCSPGDDDQCNDDEKPRHLVMIRPFRISTHEVTQAQWQAVMGVNPSSFKGEDRPVENVSWDDSMKFLERLNGRVRGGKPYRLPSEAEWEYAARAGGETPYWWGMDVGKGNANCRACGSESDSKETVPIRSFKPNAFGLYDTAGNVWEWVADCSHATYNGAPTDGSVWRDPCSYAGWVVRGGSYEFDAWDARVSSRKRNLSPGAHDSDLGLRLAQDL